LAGTVGIIGGTGPEGRGLAARFARAGREVIIGSRDAARGAEAAGEVASLSGGKASGGTNATAAAAEIVIIALPYSAQAETLAPLAGVLGARIVVSTVVPLSFKPGRVEIVPLAAGSAAEEMQALLPDARVAGAFQSLSAKHLIDLAHPVAGDVIVCSDDAEARQEVMALASLIEGVRAVDGGPLLNCRYVEGLTALQVSLNRIHKATTGIQIVGL
jgi:NADPH-dependent F420 reductase